MFELTGQQTKSVVAIAALSLLLAACVSIKPPTKIQRGGGWYTVKKTDTLYSIAWRYGLDSKRLARWNQIDVGTPIYPGQRLRLVKPEQSSLASIDRPARKSSRPKSKPITTKSDKTEKTKELEPLEDWLWPTEGKLLNTFLATDLDRRGVDIAGKLGQPIVAVADGKVVYSGNGLAGYGNLIIIKHSEIYLSAYAHCQERLVREGMAVNAGNVVAKMGSKDNTAKLHFEIRRNGKPVDPMNYLPKR